ncbi:MAG: hypothetical protein H6641_07515 [Caldilineaceae bacterium]|nr:hypothetical protein [Caldilineaceae bacterium]
MGSTLYYLHGDHLGSTALTTTGSGTGVSQTYCAYGKTRSGTTCASGNSLATDRQFTGQQYDVTGLHYYNARYFDDHIGQFVSPDSMVPDPTTLIDYNRFAYARANPLKYNDPSGHCIWDGCILELIVAGAIVGAIANGGGNAGVQIATNWESDRPVLENLTNVNMTEVGIAAGYGGIGGGLAPVTGGTSALLLNAGLGAAQEVTTDMIVDGKSFSEAVDGETLLAAGLGAAGSKIQGAIPNEFSYVSKSAIDGEVFDSLGAATGIDALAYGGEEFMRSTTFAQLPVTQLKYIGKARFVMGAGIGNVPIPDPLRCLFTDCSTESSDNAVEGDNIE